MSYRSFVAHTRGVIIEKVGDVLRYTSQWSMGLPGGDGLAATAAFTGLGPTWQCSMFDVMKAKNWEQVVAALTSNVVVSDGLIRFGSFVCEGEPTVLPMSFVCKSTIKRYLTFLVRRLSFRICGG